MMSRKGLSKDELLKMHHFFMFNSGLSPEQVILDGLCMKVLLGELKQVTFYSVWVPRHARLAIDVMTSDLPQGTLPFEMLYWSDPEIEEPEAVFSVNGVYGSSFIFTPCFNVTVH